MKQKDLLILIVVVIISGALSLVIANTVFSGAKEIVKVVKVPKLSSEFKQPDTKYFNTESVNPTQLIDISTGNGQVILGQ